jgi:hypothetical protein
MRGMTEPRVTFDPDDLDPVQRKLHAALEEQLTSALRAAAERIDAAYAGESVDEVCRRLFEETKSGLHPDIAAGFHPDHAELCQVAELIVRREFPPPT